ncbi:DUF4189 domain-containing protein [Mangrovicella endophytica]|uniref:DUF4189 domain-containing protein n=1 Tax=Mangrovicella endophytica TaxID=2066697 RepID=UPI000C9EB375|nr:DUF4189 domain-containing protein [Mangrovicella endophytica]
MKTALRLLLLLTLSSATAPALAAGAIAVADEEGLSAGEAGYGFVTGYDSRSEAADAAMQECRSQGNSDCKVAVRFDTCGAYAGNRTYFGIGWGNSEREATRKALGDCGQDSCRIVVSGCE